MRLSESTIKAAILHPEEEIRLTAARYFSGSFSQDETIMPLVIQAVESTAGAVLPILREVNIFSNRQLPPIGSSANFGGITTWKTWAATTTVSSSH